MATITLREITAATVNDFLKLKVKPEQEKFVASNAKSIAQAHFEPKAWFRAIYADETPVGFVQLIDDPETPNYYIWRFMIDAAHQRKGYGRRALQLVIDYVRSRPNAREVTLSFVSAEGGPEPLYRSMGFVPTGEVEEGEVVARLVLDTR
jgi:diamine N-acetyltransferase